MAGYNNREVDLADASGQTMPMDGVRTYSLISAVWASLAAPTALYAAPEPYPYELAAGSVAQSFAAAGSYLTAALAAQTSAAIEPSISPDQ